MKRIILSALLSGLGLHASAQLCDTAPLPYFEPFEEPLPVEGLPSCAMGTYSSFASSKIFQVSPEAVEGFSGKVAQYDLTSDLQGEGFGVGTDLYLGSFMLEEGTNYTFSFKYGRTAGTGPVVMQAILEEPVWGGFAILITNFQNMPLENGTVTQNIGVPETGIYHIRFNVEATSGDEFVYLDDVRLEEAPVAGLQDNTLSALAIYPNPVKDILTINHIDAIERVELYSSTGQLLLAEKPDNVQALLNLERLSAGVYYASISSGGLTKKVKIIKE